MNFIEKYLQSKISLFFVIGFLCITNIFSVCYFLNNENKNEDCYCEECPTEEKEEMLSTTKIKVDLKGYVKKPGVYELESGAIVNDLLKLAGGLKTNGTTDNINLSKRLNNEDVVIVLSKTELQKLNTTSVRKTNSSTTSSVKSSVSISNSNSASSNNNSTSINNSSSISNQEETNKKISINTASKEELMTLSGIGEAKANSIIAYRTSTPFKEISEIMNVSGIGQSIYEKIKDSITI